MNFQSLFKEYTPVEYGDFFRLYRINNRGYLIYCNENNVICCMELYGFTDISVIMLAELLKVNLEELEDCEEFSLPVRCSRQQIIDYLFDVSAKETYVKLKHVSGLHGYLLKSIHQDKSGLNAYRNLFQFDPVKGNTRLLFDDNQCLASIRTDKSGSVYICWDPVLFFGLDKSGDPDSTGYLLSSSSTLLIDYVLSKISCDRDIIVMAGSNYLEAQLLFAHLQVVYLDSNMMAWSKILTGTGIFNEDAEARRFVKNLRDNYLLPSDFLNYTRSSYMLELCRCCQGEYVIFDTETTGLNVFEDDIVQIAAIKVNAGKITDRFNIILHTEKPIPAMLGGIVNPLLQEYERAEKVDRKTGLCAFMDFVGDCTLIGQNVEYDCNILDYNLRRDCGDFSFFTVHPLYFDTLRVARIMAPRLKSYKLKSLLEVFGLEGENSHLADDDVIATLSVLDHFLGIFAANMQQHIDCLQYNSAVAELFRRAYADIYHGTLSRLYQRSSEYPLLVDGLEHLYDTFIQKGWIEANPKMQYIFSFLRNDVISPEKTPSLKEQLSAHLLDITTYREADLCDSSCITEKVFVSTVHKAKGLEFENVIIFEATDGVYPFFDKKTPEEIRESARLFYVAMTRAKIRLHITYAESVSGISKWGNPYSIDKEPTPFLRHIKKFFHLYSM